MPKVFITKAWGWNPETHPTFGFSSEGGRAKFLRESGPGDWLVVAGTKNDKTETDEQGHLLGMCQVGHQLVNADTIMKALGADPSGPEFHPNGAYRWPYAMPVLKAVRFNPQPDTKTILGSYLPGQEWSAFAIDVERRFGQTFVDRILALPSDPCELPPLPDLARASALEQALSLRRKNGPSGPPPSGHRGSSDRTLGVGHVYAFKLEGGKVKNAIKIGSSSDVNERQRQLNRELRYHLTGCRWTHGLTQPFPTERQAYQFEQLLLRRFASRIVEGDLEVIAMPFAEFETEWAILLMSKEWATEPAATPSPAHPDADREEEAVRN
ncbi:GIY-YIG nuclease family protein [Dongia sp.]|uniref:GIY-YIG nuclease family protein n=1 Tax=Dongia sp. TaxID=1977262 RepID=UPI00375228E3